MKSLFLKTTNINSDEQNFSLKNCDLFNKISSLIKMGSTNDGWLDGWMASPSIFTRDCIHTHICVCVCECSLNRSDVKLYGCVQAFACIYMLNEHCSCLCVSVCERVFVNKNAQRVTASFYKILTYMYTIQCTVSLYLPLQQSRISLYAFHEASKHYSRIRI